MVRSDSADDVPDPDEIKTRVDFARHLTSVRERAGLTIRDVAKAVGIPDSTIGGYFSGRHVPPLRLQAQLLAILRSCRVTDPVVTSRWLRALARVRRSPGRRPADAAVPYRGLETFQPEHAEWFHGREVLVSTVVDQVLGQWPSGNPVVVVGPSGSGKSSLLRAGLIARLTLPGVAERWVPVLFTPGADPVGELESRLRDARSRTAGNLLVVVDQFEELFTLCADLGERRRFIAALVDLAAQSSSAALVVLGLRADFYSQASRHPELVPALQHTQVVVGPMSAAELRRAIVEPARQARVEIGDELVELLLHEVAPGLGDADGAHDVGSLPLLSHALLATCQRAGRAGMTIADYHATGRISGAIARTADAVHDQLDTAQQNAARQLFLRLVHLGDGTADTRRRVPHADVLTMSEPDAIVEVLDLYVEQRMITSDVDTVHITHEALLTAWPRLRAWIDTDRAGLRVHRRLMHDSRTWEDSNRDTGVLYRGGRLATAREWAADAGHQGSLNALEREFLEASADQEQAEHLAQRRHARTLRRLVVALTVLVLIACGLTGYVVRQNATALEERDVAISRQIAGEANQVRANDVALAMQLSLAAYRISPTVEARSSLLDTTANTAATRIVGPEGAMQAVAVTPDGRTVATAGTDRTVRLWRLHDDGPATAVGTPLTGAEDTIFAVAISPDGKVLAQGGGDRAVRLWDIGDPARPSPLGTPLGDARNTVYSLAFSPDGRTLAAGSADREVHLWDLRDPARPVALPPLAGAGDFVQAVAFSPDGRTLAAGSADGTVGLWDFTPGRPVPLGAPLTGPGRKVFAVAFSPDNRTLAAGSADKDVYLWTLDDRAAPVSAGPPLEGSTSWINGLAFSRDGRTLAAGGSDNTVRLWDVATRTVARVLPHPSPVTAVAYLPNGALASAAADGVARLWTVPGPVLTDSADTVFNVLFGPGSLLATGSGVTDGRFRLWDVSDPQRPTRIGDPTANPTERNRFVGSAALSPDGRTLAAGGANGEVQLWSLDDPARPVPRGPALTGPTSLSENLAFSPDGRMLAAGSDENTVWLWNVADRERPAIPLTGPTNHVYSVAFSPDGRTLAAGSLDRDVHLWDISDPTKPQHLTAITAHANYVYSVAFSPDGAILATSSADKTIRLWDVRDRSRPTPLGSPITGPTNYVYTAVFSPDGRTLAASSADKSVWLWDVTDPLRPTTSARLTASTGSVHAVAFSSDGRVVAGGSSDRTTRLWNVDTEFAAKFVCSVSGTRLSETEWRQYAPGTPYRDPCA